MPGDHLGERQRTTAWFQNSMLDFASVQAGMVAAPSLTAADFAASRIRLPRQGQVGAQLIDKSIQFRAPARASTSEGVAIECVYLSTQTGFNFFGGPWFRDICRYSGPYSFAIGLRVGPENDDIASTYGVAGAVVSDIGQDRILSRVGPFRERRIQINDGRPHHLLVKHAPAPQLADAVTVFVDGVLQETCTLKPDCAMFDFVADGMWTSAEKFFTHADGDVSHYAASPAAAVNLPEIQARANLVKGLPNEQVMGWSSEKRAWLPVRDAVGRRKVRKP